MSDELRKYIEEHAESNRKVQGNQKEIAELDVLVETVEAALKEKRAEVEGKLGRVEKNKADRDFGRGYNAGYTDGLTFSKERLEPALKQAMLIAERATQNTETALGQLDRYARLLGYRFDGGGRMIGQSPAWKQWVVRNVLAAK